MSDGDDIHFDLSGMQPVNDNAEPVPFRLLDLAFDLPSLAAEVGYTERELADAMSALEPRYSSREITAAIRWARRSGFLVLRGNGRLYLERRVTARQVKFVRGLIAELARSRRGGE